MPLVVPALRLCVVFLNVYETFKTLKIPPPSARRGGQPSVRALTQRKRDLKGCLAIWVVWCCIAAFERMFDRIVGLLFPFYSEIKSVLLLFLLLTRAKGAEPIYLHILRPVIKPYAALLDPCLELGRDIGDFIFVLLQVPLDYALSLLPKSFCQVGEPDSSFSPSSSGTRVSSNGSGNSGRTNSSSSIPTFAKPYGTAQTSSRVQSKRPGGVRSVSDNRRRSSSRRSTLEAAPGETTVRHSKSASASSLSRYSVDVPLQDPRYSRTLSMQSTHQIWYPPASVYEGEARDSLISNYEQGFPPAPTDVDQSSLHTQLDEWRLYPPFPSAYPPTPLPATASLPQSISRASSANEQTNHRVSDISYPPIPEDPAVEPDFHQSLEQQLEPTNPGSGCSSSDKSSSESGVDEQLQHVEAVQQPMDVPSEDESHAGLSETSSIAPDEDDFNVTLRTPYRSLTYSETIASSALSSAESLPSQSSALTTAGNASSLRTSTSSESSDSHTSDSSSKAGRKRSYIVRDIKSTKIQSSHSRNATLRGKPMVIRNNSVRSNTTADGDDSEQSESGVGAKRRKVLEPTRRATHLRPAARVVNPTRRATISARGPTRTGSASSASVRSSQRPASIINTSTIRAGRGLASRQTRSGSSPDTVKRSNIPLPSQPRTLRGKVHQS
ncbi:hypothetical protein F5I97DRAFT_847497 [Phlebopus sp. FC_14]|nr:hypothetical protein F5I97DRAFT_847497 [Phlebopus sp. FC_14]